MQLLDDMSLLRKTKISIFRSRRSKIIAASTKTRFATYSKLLAWSTTTENKVSKNSTRAS